MSQIFKRVDLSAYAPEEYKEKPVKGIVFSGDRNDYPDKLLDLYLKSAKHNALINGKINFIIGNGFSIKNKNLNPEQQNIVKAFLASPNPYEDANDLLNKVAADFELFNGFYLEVIWGLNQQPVSVSHVGYNKVRTDEELNYFYVLENWGTSAKIDKAEKIPAFDPENKVGKQMIFYKKYTAGGKVYAIPDYIGALKYIEIDKEISNFHLNNLNNNFWGGFMISFNDGKPSEDAARTIERKINDKWGGTNNAGRMFITFHDSKENAPTIDAIPTSDLPDQFNLLNDQVQNELFVAHRITSPLIFGIREAGSLGNRNELIDAYELFKNIYASDRQNIICSVFNYILSFKGVDDALEIKQLEPITAQLSEQTLLAVSTKDEMRAIAGLAPLPDTTQGSQQQLINAINQLSPLVANKVLESMSADEIRAIVGLMPITPAAPAPAPAASFNAHDFDFNIFSQYGEDADNYEVLKAEIFDFQNFEEVVKSEAQLFASQYDDLDKSILKILKDDPNIPAGDIADKVDATEELVSERLNYLTEKGLIKVDRGIRKIGDNVDDYIKSTEGFLEVKYQYEKNPKFSGPAKLPTTRDFCAYMLDNPKLFSREEIDTISNITGRNVWELRGGFYTDAKTGLTYPFCRHIWMQKLVKRKS